MNEGAVIRVLHYVDELDAFLVTDEFTRIADFLGFAKAEAMGIRTFDLMIVRPEWFSDGQDGPCHTPELRKRF